MSRGDFRNAIALPAKRFSGQGISNAAEPVRKQRAATWKQLRQARECHGFSPAMPSWIFNSSLWLCGLLFGLLVFFWVVLGFVVCCVYQGKYWAKTLAAHWPFCMCQASLECVPSGASVLIATLLVAIYAFQ